MCCVFRVILLALAYLPGEIAVAQVLIPYTDGEGWGYSDRNARVILPLQWTSVNGFIGDKSIVRFQLDTGKPSSVCIIDRKGHYIIPPERRWNGLWFGYGLTDLNAQNSAGRKGLIDTNNRVIVPFEFDGSQLFGDAAHSVHAMMLRKNGRWGVVARDGRVIIPFAWRSLIPQYTQGQPFTFQAAKDESRTRYLLDSTGIQITDTGYMDFSWQEAGGIRGYSVRGPTADSTVYKCGFIGWPSGREMIPLIYDAVHPFTGGLFLAVNDGKCAILDSSGSILLPFDTAIYYTRADTIVQWQHLSGTAYNGDTMVNRVRYFDGRTVKQLSNWIIEATPPERSRYPDGGSNYRDQPQISGPLSDLFSLDPTIIPAGGKEVKTFRSKGIFWERSGWADLSENLYAVKGWRPFDSTGYCAVVDRELRFRVFPIPAIGVITHYNAVAQMIVCAEKVNVSGDFFADRQDYRYTLRNVTGRKMARAQTRTIIQSLVVRGRLYLLEMFAADRTKCFDHSTYSSSVLRLCDTTGVPIPALARYRIERPVNSAGEAVENGGILYALSDSSSREGYVDPEGQFVWPAISFRHKEARPLRAGRFLLTDGEHPRRGSIVDSAGHDLMPGIIVTSVYSESPFHSFRKPPAAHDIRGAKIHRIAYNRRGEGADGLPRSFYMDTKGTVYTNGFERHR